MIFYLIQGVRTPGKVDIIHHLLFHGDMERSDFKITDKYSHFLGEDLSQPVLLTRSGSFIPPLFQPGTSFVVTQKVFSEINSKIKVLGVMAKPKKLINCWLPKGDTSYLWSDNFFFLKGRPDKALEKANNDQALFDDFPLCYELVAFNAATDPSPDKKHELNIKLKRNDLIVIKRKVSIENMENNPLSWCGAPILRFDLYQILKKYIDQDYFEIVEISI